ncbi:hypothetical protein AB0H49_33875 [Nocardia sp. NPDC050713]|uniref:hypothetical protein n=1 Tax=Nocardia sp. NPDC050713 TaxID=3154511 RepID=UPI0033E5552C
MDYQDMAHACDRARSHAWWRNLVEHGAWGGIAGRVGPPDPDALDGIARMFGTTPEQVGVMIAADWYGVHQDEQISSRVRQLAAVIDELTEEDADLVESLARRLGDSPKQSGVLKRKN